MARKQNKILKLNFSIDVGSGDETVKGTFELDKSAHRIIGIEMSSNRPDIMFFRGTQIIKINDEEFFPEGHQTMKLMCGQNILPHERFYDLKGIDPGNRKVELIYTDTDNAAAAFEPYKAILYVYCSINED
jgi:hypothetical protein